MPSKKPNEKKVEEVKARFKLVELKTLDLEKERFFKLPYSTALEAVDAELSKTAYRLWIYLSANYPFGNKDIDLPSQTELAIRLNVSRQAMSNAFGELHDAGLLPKWLAFKKMNSSDTEYQIQQRLQSELGGQVEVVTAVGRIDLLTESEVIEIKCIDDWKEALGKILAYSAFFSEHCKRIHLFGRADLTKLALAQATCAEFNITVTFEEVK